MNRYSVNIKKEVKLLRVFQKTSYHRFSLSIHFRLSLYLVPVLLLRNAFKKRQMQLKRSFLLLPPTYGEFLVSQILVELVMFLSPLPSFKKGNSTKKNYFQIEQQFYYQLFLGGPLDYTVISCEWGSIYLPISLLFSIFINF